MLHDNLATVDFHYDLFQRDAFVLNKLKKIQENLQPRIPKLQFLKTLIFPGALHKLQNRLNFSFFLI